MGNEIIPPLLLLLVLFVHGELIIPPLLLLLELFVHGELNNSTTIAAIGAVGAWGIK